MTDLEKLMIMFEKFPGVGARQARRFAFHILNLPDASATELSELIKNIKSNVTQCESCRRYFSKHVTRADICGICLDSSRDHNKLLVVAHDNDITAIERSGLYDGLYFVLGGIVPLLHTNETNKLRGGRLKATIEARLPEGLHEIILGFSVNPDGENTARYIETIINQIEASLRSNLKVMQLGRGLSTGSELEYADPETIKNALKHRM
jgi:recombination protein RecR